MFQHFTVVHLTLTRFKNIPGTTPTIATVMCLESFVNWGGYQCLPDLCRIFAQRTAIFPRFAHNVVWYTELDADLEVFFPTNVEFFNGDVNGPNGCEALVWMIEFGDHIVSIVLYNTAIIWRQIFLKNLSTVHDKASKSGVYHIFW